MAYERKDSDKVFVQAYHYDNIYLLQIIPFYILYYALNFAIAIVGIYSVPKLLQQSVSFCQKNSNSLTITELNALYWATVLVCATINIVCTVVFHSSKYIIKENDYIWLYYIIFPLKIVIFFFEVISIWIIIKNFKVRDSICCFTNHYVLRAIHTLAICHILWFLHRVGCSLLVAIFFIALAPAQTLAAIFLIYFVIFCTILYVAFNLYYFNKMRCCTKQSCKTSCKLFTLFILYSCIVGSLLCLTLLFSQLAENGLTSSGLGSVVLSLVAPTIVFIITLRLKHHLEKYFIADSDVKLTDVITDDSNESAVQATEPSAMSLLQELDSKYA